MTSLMGVVAWLHGQPWHACAQDLMLRTRATKRGRRWQLLNLKCNEMAFCPFIQPVDSLPNPRGPLSGMSVSMITWIGHV